MPTAKLTARNVGTLPAPAAGRVEYRDESLPGFYLRVTASGVRTYGAWCRIRGRGKRASFGRHPVIGLADARIKARAFLRSAADGHDSTRERRTPDFATILNAYVEARTGTIANSTRTEYMRIISAYTGPLARMPAGQVNADDIERLLERIAQRAPAMANRVFQFLRAACRRAHRRGLLNSNPTSPLDRPRPDKTRERTLSLAEISILWQALQEESRPQTAAVVKMLVLLGQRSTETSEMRWADLDLAHGLWTIPGQYRKGGRLHVVPLPELAVHILRALPQQGDRVFVGVSEANAERDWWSRIRRRTLELAAQRGVAMQRFTKHDLRRTAMTGMTRLGIIRFIAQRVIGHKEPGVGSTYDRYDYLAEKAEALRRWAAEVATTTQGATPARHELVDALADTRHVAWFH